MPTGYKIVRIPFDAETGMPSSAQPEDFMCFSGQHAKWTGRNLGIRPVDVAFDSCNRLLVSSDGTKLQSDGRVYGGGVLLVSYREPSAPESPVPDSADSGGRRHMLHAGASTAFENNAFVALIAIFCLACTAVAVRAIIITGRRGRALLAAN